MVSEEGLDTWISDEVYFSGLPAVFVSGNTQSRVVFAQPMR